MADDYYRDVVAELGRMGFVYWTNAKGSHEKWRNTAIGTIVIVPGT